MLWFLWNIWKSDDSWFSLGIFLTCLKAPVLSTLLLHLTLEVYLCGPKDIFLPNWIWRDVMGPAVNPSNKKRLKIIQTWAFYKQFIAWLSVLTDLENKKCGCTFCVHPAAVQATSQTLLRWGWPADLKASTLQKWLLLEPTGFDFWHSFSVHSEGLFPI